MPGPGAETMTGAGGTEVVRYRALAPGKTNIVLEYRPPGRSGAPGRPRTITVVVG